MKTLTQEQLSLIEKSGGKVTRHKAPTAEDVTTAITSFLEQFAGLITEIRKPEIVEKIVEVPVDRVVEVPVDRVVEKVVERVVEKAVNSPVERKSYVIDLDKDVGGLIKKAYFTEDGKETEYTFVRNSWGLATSVVSKDKVITLVRDEANQLIGAKVG